MTVDEKLDKIADRLNSIDKTLAAQHVNLVEHMRRTNLLERRLEPIQSHVDRVAGAVKLLSVAAVVTGVLEVLVRWARS